MEFLDKCMTAVTQTAALSPRYIMSTKAIKILIVEDEDSVRISLSMLLEELGYIVKEVSNGLEAWGMIPAFEPDIILTDLHMPVMDGLELLEKISTQELSIPVIIVSGQGTTENTIKALQLGAYGYITKPLSDLKFLTHALEKAYEKQELINLAKNYQVQFERELENKTQELNKTITHLKKIEEQLSQAKQDWENTVDAIPDLVALYDKNHQIIRLNKSMADLFGCSVHDLPSSALCVFNDNCKNNHDCPHSRVVKSGNAERLEHQHRASGIIFETQVIPYTREGEILGTIIFARDISKMKSAQKEHEILQARLLQAQKLESVGQLASGIAHEINTPTQYVSSNLEFLNEAYLEVADLLADIRSVTEQDESSCSKKITQLFMDADLDYLKEEVPIAINQSREGTDRIRSIVLAMKEFSHPGSKQKEIADINKIINTTVTVARNEWKYVSEVTTVLDPDVPLIKCLTDEVGQVFLNILVNAAQAIGEKLGKTPTGGKGKITITTKHDDSFITIFIEDNGPGIPASIVNKVFDPFFTTKEVGKGTGQGLAIAHDVIKEKHGGFISVESKSGVGSRFIIKLPIQEQQSTTPKNQQTS